MPGNHSTSRLSELEHQLFRQVEALSKDNGGKLIFVLCVSGGVDSMALLNTFHRVINHRIAAPLPSIQLHVLHCNHERRGLDSDADAEFVKQRCQELQVPCCVERWSETGPRETSGSFQNLARIWRYQRAQTLLDSLSPNATAQRWTVTAHHARDNAESLLLHIIRGTGASGLQGIRSLDRERRLFRPFARVPIAKIKEYAAGLEMEFRQDASNDSNEYDRNFVRNRILPLVAEKNPAYELAFLRLADNIIELLDAADANLMTTPLVPDSSLTSTQILRRAKNVSPDLVATLTTRSLENLLHHCQLVTSKGSAQYGKIVTVKLGSGWEATISPEELAFMYKGEDVVSQP